MFPDMKLFDNISEWFAALARVFANQFRLISKDGGVIIFFVLLPLAYPVVYTLIYNKELVREIPVAVVDDSRTSMSRQFVRTAQASPVIDVYDYADNMQQAKQMMAERKVFGVLYIPYDYARDIGSGVTSHVMFYSDMSLLLRYRAFMAALTDIQVEVGADITGERIADIGASSYVTGNSPLPVNSQSNFLGDVEQGFASFVIPGIVILILQQSMLLGIGMLEGTSNERRKLNSGIDPKVINGIPASAVVWGRTLCFFVIYIAFAIYNTQIIPALFKLPQYGNPVDFLLFLVPFLLATAFLGQTMAPLMRERESPFIIIVATSVVFLFLSGLTWPRYAMGPVWHTIGNFIPATWGVEGFIRINSNAATLEQNSVPYLWLWGLAALYMVTAILITRYHRRKNERLAYQADKNK